MRSSLYLLRATALLVLALSAACSSADPPITNPDTGQPDTEAPDAGDPPDAEDDTDADPIEDVGSQPSPPAEVERAGAGGFLLRGTVLTLDGPIDDGEVLIEGGAITCVADDCSGEPGAATVTVINTNGVISPGLIDAHNHLPYNFLMPWIPGDAGFFGNRYQWAEDPGYEAHVAPYANRRSTGTHYCPAAKWGELRSVIHGTTTVMGQSFQQRCVDWGTRNADHYHGLGYNHMRTTIGSPRDITDSDAESYIESFNDPDEPKTRLAVHMAEGISGDNIELEFSSFAGRDTRDNRHAGTSLLYNGTAMLIHSVALTDAELEEVYMTDSKIVWSPSSNLALYGVTADIESILDLGIITALGPDWTVSGEFDMLAEMRVAYRYGQEQEIEALTPQRIWEMATWDGAIAVGLEHSVGQLEPGYGADIVVFGRQANDPYLAVLESEASDVRLSMIDGQVYFGDADLEEAAARNEFCETFPTCGTSKFLCVQDSPSAGDRRDETYAAIRQQLIDILEGTGYPEDEQYGRGDELLDLVLCP
ncbi:amidohydrolase family protein [Lujinxingia vulgaris]|uniref:Amidohydrolase family protein n=1 Tax=Lujinxingia vulgaris TaxID=2600176 RepID=A0A5C6WT95_9DELT|nr:amidohydrolase family protein [Lujinxingia vulgaris]TXD31641.1 amidohydrolase family protein [Lujinxingia vulgaris]